ncbi:MAG TPA: bifunctional nicotinamidase/pyrazinamidase [Nitrospirae bacterium]|nr:bifunctional nicotinamidase/pyrazinamidase [Nitrospirota bacterium]
MPGSLQVTDTDLLAVVDIQNDFLPGGALAVPEGDDVIPAINRITCIFPHIILTQDWHPENHSSFASSNAGKKPYDTVATEYGEQVLWPDHCVQGTHGAKFHKDLHIPGAQLIIRKGFHKEIDSYSAFVENDRKTPTGLGGYIRERGFKRIFITGLATDFCVQYTALNAIGQGFKAFVIEDACRGIDIGNSLDDAWRNMERAGVTRIAESDLAAP